MPDVIRHPELVEFSGFRLKACRNDDVKTIMRPLITLRLHKSLVCLPMRVADSRIRQIESLLPKALARDREAIRHSLARLRGAGGMPERDGALDRIEAQVGGLYRRQG